MGRFDDEPTMDDVLSDPTILALMERDKVEPQDLRMLIDSVRRSLGADAPGRRRHGLESGRVGWHGKCSDKEPDNDARRLSAQHHRGCRQG